MKRTFQKIIQIKVNFLRSILVILLYVFIINSSFSQKEANNWYFGEYAGITFNTDPPSDLQGSSMNAAFGCNSFSDKYGNLLFYTNGQDVWNANHQVMQNGHFVSYYYGATTSTISIPFYNDSTKYHLFCIPGSGAKSSKGNDGLYHSVIEPYYNNGQGRITNKDEFIYGYTYEKMAITRHANGKDWWIVIHGYPGNTFLSFIVDENGVNTTPIISNIGHEIPNLASTIGYFRFTSNGSFLAAAYKGASDKVEIYKFNNENGTLSDVISLDCFEDPFGLEFSPDNNKLYIAQYLSGWGTIADTLFQIDISSYNYNDVLSSKLN